MAALHLCMFVECMARYRVCPAWTNRMYVCNGVCLNLKVLLGVWCSMTLWMSPWRAVQIHHNGDDGSLCVCVRSMSGTVSCSPWTNRKYVCNNGVCEFEAAIGVRCSMRSQSHSDLLSKYYNGDGGCLFVYVRWMFETGLYWPWTTACTFVIARCSMRSCFHPGVMSK